MNFSTLRARADPCSRGRRCGSKGRKCPSSVRQLMDQLAQEREALPCCPSLPWRHLSANLLHGTLDSGGRMRSFRAAVAGASPFGETTDSAPLLVQQVVPVKAGSPSPRSPQHLALSAARIPIARLQEAAEILGLPSESGWLCPLRELLKLRLTAKAGQAPLQLGPPSPSAL